MRVYTDHFSDANYNVYKPSATFLHSLLCKLSLFIEHVEYSILTVNRARFVKFQGCRKVYVLLRKQKMNFNLENNTTH